MPVSRVEKPQWLIYFHWPHAYSPPVTRLQMRETAKVWNRISWRALWCLFHVLSLGDKKPSTIHVLPRQLMKACIMTLGIKSPFRPTATVGFKEDSLSTSDPCIGTLKRTLFMNLSRSFIRKRSEVLVRVDASL